MDSKKLAILTAGGISKKIQLYSLRQMSYMNLRSKSATRERDYIAMAAACKTRPSKGIRALNNAMQVPKTSRSWMG